MMRNLSSVGALMALMLLGGCQSVPETTFDYDRTVDFARYQTFSWINDHPLGFHSMESHAGPLLERPLMEATRELLPSKNSTFDLH